MTDEKRLDIVRRTKGISIVQNNEEILWALEECRKYLGDKKVKRFLEIGCYAGGSLCMWDRLLADDGELYAISPNDSSKILKERVKLITGRDINFINGRSENPETMVTLLQMLGNNKLDGIFLDTLHTYEQSKKEFLLYSPLVNSPGIFCFHDIVQGGLAPLYNKPCTGDFWHEIKYDYNYIEKHNKDGGVNFGIGMLFL